MSSILRASMIQTPTGVTMGLAWTAMDGSTLYVETTRIEEGAGKGALDLTGKLGGVVKESARIAHTVARAILQEKESDYSFFANSRLHLHVLAGATPEDGPSAGCTMVTSLIVPCHEEAWEDFDKLADNVKEGLDVHFVDGLHAEY